MNYKLRGLLSKTKTVFIVQQENLSTIKRKEFCCARCSKEFELDDIIATSTRKRYCYRCATGINLVSGNLEKDFQTLQLKSKTINTVKNIVKKNNIEKQIELDAIGIIKEYFTHQTVPTKNSEGMASAAILIACDHTEQDDTAKPEMHMPVSEHVLQKHKSAIQSILDKYKKQM